MAPFVRFARVLAATAATHCPHWRRCIDHVSIDRTLYSPLGLPSHVHNTQKMEAWWARVMAEPDGTPVLLMDADTMIVRPLDDIWDRAFDVAYTVKPESERFPFNSGVVFLRVSPRVRAFVQAWRDENRYMLAHPVHHQEWRKRYGGINQAALGQMFTTGVTAGLDVLAIPCQEWNCEDSSWAAFDPEVTRIVHLKGALRQAVLGVDLRPSDPLRMLRDRWRTLEAAATRGPKVA
jgi:hypothetical protein